MRHELWSMESSCIINQAPRERQRQIGERGRWRFMQIVHNYDSAWTSDSSRSCEIAAFSLPLNAGETLDNISAFDGPTVWACPIDWSLQLQAGSRQDAFSRLEVSPPSLRPSHSRADKHHLENTQRQTSVDRFVFRAATAPASYCSAGAVALPFDPGCLGFIGADAHNMSGSLTSAHAAGEAGRGRPRHGTKYIRSGM